MMSSARLHRIELLLHKCRYEKDVDTQVHLLSQINRFLPDKMQLKLPSLFTDDYVRTALDTIEESLLIVNPRNSRIP
jgi:hypothetical protein